MPNVTVFNSTDRPVVIDADGHTVAGGEWRTVDSSSAPVVAALDAGWLVTVDKPASGADLDPRAAEVFGDKPARKGTDDTKGND